MLQRTVLGLMAGVMAVLIATASHADSLLGVAPLRVYVTDTKTNELISLTNRSNDVRTYKISMLDQVMDGNGNMRATDTFPYSAKRLLRFMPRQVTLQPGEHQSLRVMVMPRADLPEGEYHTHLIFDEVPIKRKAEAAPEPGLKIKMENQYSVGIPLIYRHGKVQGSLKLEGADLRVGKTNKPEFHVRLQRTGNGEGYGVLRVLEKGTKGDGLILPRKTYVYREVDKLALTLPLNDKETSSLQALQHKDLQVHLDVEGMEPQILDVKN